MSKIQFIDEINIQNKKILLRVDFNVSFEANNQIADDTRIQQSLPTIKYLLNNQNTLILVSHLGKPKGRDTKYSLKIVADRLQIYFPDYKIILIDDFTNMDKTAFVDASKKEIYILENIRFYPQEKENNEEFAKKLSSLADIYVNDAFGVCHRTNTSVVGIPKYLPSYAGLLLKKEISMISQLLKDPKKPFVALLGGIKISTKIRFIDRLMELADSLIVGGGLANVFFLSQKIEIGKSICEKEEIEMAASLLLLAAKKNTKLHFPSDAIVTSSPDAKEPGTVKKIGEIGPDDYIVDIGPETEAEFAIHIASAKTIVWNGPFGYIENPTFRRGTDFIFYSIAQNKNAVSIVGGGDTLAAVSKKDHLDKITHISTGGGAMLEFIEKGTLPGIEALKLR